MSLTRKEVMMFTEHEIKLSQAHWIWTASSRPNQWVVLRRSFPLTELPMFARVTLAVDSKYWLYVNGQLVVFEGDLKRGPTPTDTYCDEVDLTHVLVKGQNIITVLVWYFGKAGFSHRDSGAGGLFWDAPFLVSDTTWRASIQDTWRTQRPFLPIIAFPNQISTMMPGVRP